MEHVSEEIGPQLDPTTESAQWLRKPKGADLEGFSSIGETGFEPATARPPAECDPQLHFASNSGSAHFIPGKCGHLVGSWGTQIGNTPRPQPGFGAARPAKVPVSKILRAEGLEPPRAFAHRLLRPACLPIPPRPRRDAAAAASRRPRPVLAERRQSTPRARQQRGRCEYDPHSGPGAQIGKGSGLKSRRSQELVGSSPTPGIDRERRRRAHGANPPGADVDGPERAA